MATRRDWDCGGAHDADPAAPRKHHIDDGEVGALRLKQFQWAALIRRAADHLHPGHGLKHGAERIAHLG